MLNQLRIVIVAEHASAKWGGEAILPLHYFRNLRARGVEAWLVVHERTREELDALLPGERERIHYVPETAWMRLLFKVGRKLPHTLSYFTFQLGIRALTQLRARQIVRRLVREHGVDVVHQPMPVSPRESSLMHSVGAPVVIGPMNGGMTYPPAFRHLQGGGTSAFVRAGRFVANLINRLMPGKLRAEALLVANGRTRRALPAGARGRVIELVENGVDLSLWAGPVERPAGAGPVRFLFAGRLIEWKGADLLLEAFARVADREATLDIVGEGHRRGALEEQARRLGVAGRVRFRGWLLQAELATELRSADVFVLPSLYECGGAVVLEAMACAVPVIATDWGGPADYIDSSCGVLVPPVTREGFVAGLAEAMGRLAADPGLRRALGRAGRARAEREFDWERKVDRVMQVYAAVAAAHGRGAGAGGGGGGSRGGSGGGNGHPAGAARDRAVAAGAAADG